jgi:hypothetical protein
VRCSYPPHLYPAPSQDMADVSPTRAQHNVLTLTDCVAARSLKRHDNASAYEFPMFSRPTTSNVCLARLAGGECLHQHELVRLSTLRDHSKNRSPSSFWVA